MTGAIEYGLIAALIAVVIIAAITLVGGELNTTFTTIQGALANANAGSWPLLFTSFLIPILDVRELRPR